MLRHHGRSLRSRKDPSIVLLAAHCRNAVQCHRRSAAWDAVQSAVIPIESVARSRALFGEGLLPSGASRVSLRGRALVVWRHDDGRERCGCRGVAMQLVDSGQLYERMQ